jgi:hypothetical protein
MLQGFLHSVVVPVHRACDLMASWRILVHADIVATLYSPGSGLKGSLPSTRAWSQSVRQFKGLADGGACARQGPAWRCSIRTGLHNAGDGGTGLEMATQGRR